MLPALTCALLLLGGTAGAQDWPTKTITLVVPYTPGGTTDNILRAIQPELGEQLRQPVVVKKRPGASGNVGNRAGGAGCA